MHNKYYNVSVTGNVQDVGFRKFIEKTANYHRVQGFVYNDPDGTVKMLCAGTTESVNKFLHELEEKAPENVEIGQFKKTEIPIPENIDLNIPPHFLKLETEELSDINRKLDVGIDYLKTLPDITDNTSDIKQSVSSLPEIKSGIDNLNSKFDDFITEQKEHNNRMDQYLEDIQEHNKRMDQYLEDVQEHNKRMDQYLEDVQEHNKKMDTRLDRMDHYLENQQEHNQRLEKILQKLSED